MNYEEFFANQGLNPPYIPSKVALVDESVFGTQKPENLLYDIETYIAEFLTKPTSNYILTGISGRGTESFAIHYYAANEHLGLFIQLNMGATALTIGEPVQSRINGLFGAIPLIFDAAKELKKRRLLIVQSDFYGKGWGWTDDPSNWHQETEEATALFSGLEELLKATQSS